jgi:two-component system sensor histidine kinase KdpD
MNPARPQADPPTPKRGAFRDYAKVVAVMSLLTLAGSYSPLSYHALGYVFLLAVIALSLGIGRWPALFAAVLGGMAWDFFFVPPRLSFSGIHFDEGLLLTTYFAVALIGSQLSALRAEVYRAGLLAESERMHQTLLDSVSHEMMTPLAVFRAAIEQLGTSDAEKRQRVIVELQIATGRLDRLVGNLLSQNRLESGVMRPRMDWCECHEIVAAARRAVGSRIGDHPLEIDIPADFPIFRADAALLEQAVAQLLANAAIHTPPETKIRVSAQVDAKIEKILIIVTDNGPGVPTEIQDKVFEKFVRGPATRKGGLGLGLSIVRGFMKSQGGDVTLDGAPEGGARFILSLPHEKQAPVPIG